MTLPRSVLLVLLLGCATSKPGEVQLAPNAPVDRPISTESDETREFDRKIQPYVEQARASYPEAKRRYLAGLPAGQSFFVTVRLYEGKDFEQVFLAVDRIGDGKITGRIWNDLNRVRSYHLRQSVQVPEGEVMDWLISKPDGSEEGNFVGKFIDTLQQGR